ncbi:MAG TPA: hypothetical protein VGD67_08255 [Pseudonocardiaceae bacterium]
MTSSQETNVACRTLDGTTTHLHIIDTGNDHALVLPEGGTAVLPANTITDLTTALGADDDSAAHAEHADDTDPADAGMDHVQVSIPNHCDAVFRGHDIRAVLTRLTTWVRRRHDDITIIDVHYRKEREPDPTPLVPGDQRIVYTLTLEFKLDAMLDLDWETA